MNIQINTAEDPLRALSRGEGVSCISLCRDYFSVLESRDLSDVNAFNRDIPHVEYRYFRRIIRIVRARRRRVRVHARLPQILAVARYVAFWLHRRVVIGREVRDSNVPSK